MACIGKNKNPKSTADLVHVVSTINFITAQDLTYEPRQANLYLRAFRHDKFQLRMSSHSEGPEIWFSV